MKNRTSKVEQGVEMERGNEATNLRLHGAKVPSLQIVKSQFFFFWSSGCASTSWCAW